MGPVTVVKLAQATVMDRTTLTRNLQILEKRKLIEIKTGEDRREREVALRPPQGWKSWLKPYRYGKKRRTGVKRALGEDKMDNLMHGLSKMVSRFREE